MLLNTAGPDVMLPLGGQGTMILTGRLGKSCAKAPTAAAIARTGIHRVIIALPRPDGGRDFRIPAWICWNMRVILLFTAGSRGRSRRSDRRVPTCLQPKGSKFSGSPDAPAA